MSSYSQRMLARDSATVLYRQIMDRVRHDINAGTLLPHGQLPSERDFVRELGVSRITVRQALRELVQQGYLYTVPGKGFFVSDRHGIHDLMALQSFTALMSARGVTPSSRVLEARLVPAPAALARQLQVAPGTELVSLVRLRLGDDLPMSVQQSWLPHLRCPGLLERDLTTMSLYTELRECYDVMLSRAQTTISARLATAQECTWLEMRHPSAVLIIDQVTYDADGRPVELLFSQHHPDRYPLSLTQGWGESALSA